MAPRPRAHLFHFGEENAQSKCGDDRVSLSSESEMFNPRLEGIRLLQLAAHRLTNNEAGFDPLLDLAGGASFVLLGEASHGTHEFYSTRAEITKRLIKEKRFQAVAVEADWPDAHRIDRYVRGRNNDSAAAQALSEFARFPVWMWRNRDVEAFVSWLRAYKIPDLSTRLKLVLWAGSV